MAQKLGEAEVEIVVPLARFKRQLEQAARTTKKMADRMVKSLDRVGKKMTSVGKSFATKLTAPMALAFAAMGKTAADFELSMSRIIGLVGIAESQVNKWKESLLELGPAVGKGPGELAEGLFFVTSAGFRGAEALDVLEQSAKAASAGLGETKTVADAATSAINAYGEGNLDAGTAVGILVGTVREGKAEASSIAGVLGQVLPIAAELGVGFDQVGASIAAMTRLGLPAEEAVTSLKATLSSLTKVTPDAESAIEDMGLTVEGLQADMKKPGGLLNVLEQLKEKVETTDVEMVRIFPNIRALTGVLGLVGKNGKITKDIFAALAKDGVETLNTAFAVAAKTNSFKMDQAMVRLSNTMIRLGDVVLVVLVPVLTSLSNMIEGISIAFSKLDSSTKAIIVVVTGMTAVFGPLLIAFGLLAQVLSFVGAGLVKLVAVAKVAMGLLIKVFAPIFTIPGLIIISLTTIAGAFIVFKETIVGLATGIVSAVHKQLVTNFHNNILIPFVEQINKAIDFLPDMVKKKLGLELLFVPDAKEGTLGDDLAATFAEALATGKVEAENFKTGIEVAFANIKSAFTNSGAGGLLADVEEEFENLKDLMDAASKKSKDTASVFETRWLEAAAKSKESIAASLEDMIVNFQSLGDAVRSIAKIIKDELIRALIAEPVAGFIASTIGTMFGLPGAAGGGDISGPTVVGERGPEIFVPKSPGTIMNNSNSKKAMSGGGVTVVQNITFTTDVQKTVRAEIINAAPVLANIASEQVFDRIGRRGTGQ